MRWHIGFGLGVGLLLMGCGGGTQKVDAPKPVSRSGSPERKYELADDPGVLAPGDGGKTPADRVTTRRIRAAIMQDEELAPVGSNVVISTEQGRVRVKGRVATKQEQRAIAAMVEKQTGAQPAANELQVDTKAAR